jgi:hypothetical protein
MINKERISIIFELTEKLTNSERLDIAQTLISSCAIDLDSTKLTNIADDLRSMSTQKKEKKFTKKAKKEMDDLLACRKIKTFFEF